MGPVALVLHRARAGLGLLLTILTLSAATTAIIAGTLGYSQAAATVAARQALTDAVPTEAGIRVQTRIAADPAAQDAAARRIIDEAFAGTDVRVQHTRVSEPRSVADQEGRLTALASSSLLTGDPEFGERVEVVEGSWPADAGLDGTVPGALHAGAADRWGVGTGDTLEVGDTTVTVTALWRAVDPQAAFWFGDPLVASGGTESEVGPLVVHPDAITSLGGTPFVRWTVQPDATEITPADMPTLASAASRLQSAMKTPEVDVRGVTVDGDLAPTTATAARNLATARALNVVPVMLLLLVSVIAIVQIARLQSQSRSGEVELLIARGAARGQVLRWTLMESVVVAAVATALGIGAALVVMRFVPAGAQQGATVVRAGLLTGLAVLLALAVIALLQVRSLSARIAATDRSGRTRQVAALGTLVLTLGAAALTWWQLRQYGSPLVTGDDGTLSTDLVAGAAPALLLAAAAVVAMALLGPAGRVAEAVTRPTRGLAAHLAAGQVSRRLVVYAVPVVLTVLAVGATTVSALYAATSANLRSQLAVLGEGADVRVLLASQPGGGVGEVPPTPDASDVAGVVASAPVWRAEARLGVGGDPSQVLALPIDRMDEVVLVPEGLDLAGLQEQLRPERYADWAALAIPAEATTLTFDLTVETSMEEGAEEQVEDRLTAYRDLLLDQLGSRPPENVEQQVEEDLELRTFHFRNEHAVSPVAWVEDTESGRIHAVDLAPVGYRFDVQREGTEIRSSALVSEGSSTLTLPDHGTQRLLGITMTIPEFGQPFLLDLQITGITADTEPATDLLAGAPELRWGDAALPVEQDTVTGTLGFRGIVGESRGQWLGDVAPRPITMLPAEPTGASDGSGAGASDGSSAGAAPASGVAPVDSEPVPVAVTTGLASANNLDVGSAVTLNALGVSADGEVATIIDAVPGIAQPQALLVDSRSYAAHVMPDQRALTAANELWLASSDPQVTVEQLSGRPEVDTVTGPGSVAVTDAASAVRLVFWVASTGAVLLAVTGIGAVAAALLGGRRPEVAVLRALGMTPGGQARSRAAELLGVVALSGLLGLGAGWLVGFMVIPELARSTTAASMATLPARLRLEVAPWATLLGLLVATMLVLVTALAWRVRRQALDNEYREEIR